MLGDETAYVVIVYTNYVDSLTDEAIDDAFPEAVVWRVEMK